MDDSTWEVRFGELRSLAHGEATAQAWSLIGDILDAAWQVDAAVVDQQWVPYLLDLFEHHWPLELRTPRPHWFDEDKLPLLALSHQPGAKYLFAQHFEQAPTTAKLPQSCDAPVLECSHIFDVHSAQVLALATYGTHFVSVDSAGHWLQWQSASGVVVAQGQIELLPHEQPYLLDVVDDVILVTMRVYGSEVDVSWRVVGLSLTSGKVLWQTPQMIGFVCEVRLSPDRQHVLIATIPQRQEVEGVLAWSIQSEQFIQLINYRDRDDMTCENIVMHPNGRDAMICEQTRLFATELVSKRPRPLDVPEEAWTINAKFSPDGSVFCTDLDNRLACFDPQNGQLVASTPLNYSSYQYTFSPRSRYLATGCESDFMRWYLHSLFDLEEGRMLGSVFMWFGNGAIALSDDAAMCAISKGSSIRLYPFEQPESGVDRELPHVDFVPIVSEALTSLNDMLFEQSDEYDLEWLQDSQPEAFARKWLGFPPATEAQILAAEARLGRRLPPSYRAFLACANGWLNHAYFPIGICALLGTEELFWVKDRQVLQWQGEQEYNQVPFYDMQADWFFPWPAREQMLVIGHGDGNEYLLLNPCEQTPRGEWEVWSWHKECGFVRAESFLDFIDTW